MYIDEIQYTYMNSSDEQILIAHVESIKLHYHYNIPIVGML